MPARTRTVTVTEEVFELTRDELLSLKTAMWGGNAIASTAELITIAAAVLAGEGIPRGRGTVTGLCVALRERAKLLERGIKTINDTIWPGAVWPEVAPKYDLPIDLSAVLNKLLNLALHETANDGFMETTPPQSQAAWNIANAIQAEIDALSDAKRPCADCTSRYANTGGCNDCEGP